MVAGLVPGDAVWHGDSGHLLLSALGTLRPSVSSIQEPPPGPETTLEILGLASDSQGFWVLEPLWIWARGGRVGFATGQGRSAHLAT